MRTIILGRFFSWWVFLLTTLSGIGCKRFIDAIVFSLQNIWSYRMINSFPKYEKSFKIQIVQVKTSDSFKKPFILQNIRKFGILKNFYAPF